MLTYKKATMKLTSMETNAVIYGKMSTYIQQEKVSLRFFSLYLHYHDAIEEFLADD